VLNEPDKISIRTRKNKKSPWLMCTWDVARAEKAGNTKGLYWQRDPQAALRNAVWKDIYRTHYRDALGGMIYTPEDFGVMLDANGDVIESPTLKDTKDLNEQERQLEPKYIKPPAEKMDIDQIIALTEKEAGK